MKLNIIQVDAFTDRPFAGNPAAICVTDSPLEASLMQLIAAEMNLSETAFLHPLNGEKSDDKEGYSLRWFTPAVEVDLCGHATLASAHVLWNEGYLPADQMAHFSTQSGWLSAKQQQSWIEMDFPARPVRSTHVMPQLIASLCCGGNIRAVSKSEAKYLVELRSEQAVRALHPNFDEMKKLPVQGVIATAIADHDDYDFVSRYFAPAAGINEDPVTGSAHASLAPYWQERLGKSEMLAQQVSARSGIVRVRCARPDSNTAESAEDNRIAISGQALTVLKGTLQLP